MRIQPRPTVAVAIWAAYIVVVLAIWKAVGFDYETFADSPSGLVSGIILPIGVGAALLAVFTTWAGWWGPAMREPRGIGPRWLLIVPILLFIIVVINTIVADPAAAGLDFVLVAVAGTALIGFSEELLTRGLVIVGLRGRWSEPWVWLGSSLSFGLLHAINVLVGQGLDTTLVQVVFTFVLGSALYLCRMVTGMLIVPMVLHMLWDFSSFTATYNAPPGDALFLPGQPFVPIVAIITFVGLYWVFKDAKTVRAAEPGAARAES